MFLLEYLKHPVSVGAIAPSSPRLAQKMMEPVNFETADTIVEYGPGTGAFTNEILKRKRPCAKLILIEQNKSFYQELCIKYKGIPNLLILNDSAELADLLLARHLNLRHADVILSGLPFTSLPSDVSFNIFEATLRLLREDGMFITFQYSKVKEKTFAKFFEIKKRLYEKKNLPPAYVYVLTKKRNDRGIDYGKQKNSRIL